MSTPIVYKYWPRERKLDVKTFDSEAIRNQYWRDFKDLMLKYKFSKGIYTESTNTFTHTNCRRCPNHCLGNQQVPAGTTIAFQHITARD